MEKLLDSNDLKETTFAKNLTLSGKLLIAATGGIGIGISIVCGSFVAPAFRRFCLPYVPATSEQIKNVLSCIAMDCKKPKMLLDIGSGDGRIVIATSKYASTIVSHGVEINPWLVWYSRLISLRNNNVKFFRKDLWKFDISNYNYIVIFGVEQMMKDFETKLINECKPKTKIIACRFPMPSIPAIKIIENGVNTVWLYEIKDSRK